MWRYTCSGACIIKGGRGVCVVNPFCSRLIGLIALPLHCGFRRRGASVTSWVIHLHSSSSFFLQETSRGGEVGGVGLSYLSQTTLQGPGLDDISWNKAAENAEKGLADESISGPCQAMDRCIKTFHFNMSPLDWKREKKHFWSLTPDPHNQLSLNEWPPSACLPARPLDVLTFCFPLVSSLN